MTVHLVGAGPGDPGLLTVRAAELLRRAEVVVFDRLAEASLLDLAPAAALRIDVGKQVGGPVRQDAINALLVEHGKAGRMVVRLKGGDPFVFGRGGEEALALMEAGVAFEVVPGITSAVAVPAYAGIPVTHRGRSTSFTVVTGHSRHGPDRPTDWEALARAGDTIIVLMGVSHRKVIAERLMAGGLPPDTPVAAITWGTRAAQRTVRTTLDGLAAAAVEPPATIVVGQVAGLDLAWFERRPLFGRRVVVTRSRDQASALVSRLASLGAEAIELPAIRIADPADGGAALRGAAAITATYDWVILTSPRTVERFWPHLRDARDLGTAKVACIGSGTVEALARFHVVADLVPDRFVAEGLLEAWPADPPDGRRGRVLLPRAAVARDVIPTELALRGWDVDVVEAYRTEPADPDPEALERARTADAICFTASSTVTNYLRLAGGAAAIPPVVASIGPATSATARQAGLTVTVEAEDQTIDGLVTALTKALARPG